MTKIYLRLIVILTAVFLTSCIPAEPTLDNQLSDLIQQFDVQPLNEPERASPEKIKLGEMLFWDPELSGNRDIACATCHHPSFGSGDGLSLPVGTGGRGVGDARILGEDREFVPRNATPIYNLGYPEWNVMFWDGRVNGDAVHGFENPASDDLPEGLDNALAVQAMFPVTSRDEMRGDRGDDDIFGNENKIAWIKDVYPERIWSALMIRLMAIPEYVDLFELAYPSVPTDNLGFEHVANAMAAYEASVFSFIDTPWDEYLRGDLGALSDEAKQGAILFYGDAGCADCHSGDHFTDWDYHNLAVPHVGPGKSPETPLDYGRARVTGDDCDRGGFRTPPLRNVAITGPWMHNGAYTTLDGAVRHHLNPTASLQNYDSSQLSTEIAAVNLIEQPDDGLILSCQTTHTEIVDLSDEQIQLILAFLESLTSRSAVSAEHLIPVSVPSGLPVGGN